MAASAEEAAIACTTYPDADSVDIVFQADDRTPCLFVSGLLESTFGFPEAQAAAFAGRLQSEGRAGCGRYPKAVAEALLKVAEMRIEESGHPLEVTLQPGSWSCARHVRPPHPQDVET